MSASVGHAGAGETHAGRNGEGEPAAGPGCNEGEWSHTGVSVTHIQDSAAQRHPDTVTSMGNTPPAPTTTGPHASMIGYSQHPPEDTDMLWTLSFF